MLRATLDVIVERGYADTRIADVAERTGTSPALVIYYFKTRDQLLTEAIRYSEDSWYAEYLRRMEEIPTAAGRLAELIGMICLPGTDPEPRSSWLLWLDLWALSPRSPGVAAVRQKSDERWREAIRSVVLAGQEAGEFAPVDADDFTITLSALLDGLAVQIALEDPQVPPRRTYELAIRFAAGQLGFDSEPAPAARADAERRRTFRPGAGHPGALLPAAGRAAGAGGFGAGGSGAGGRATGRELGSWLRDTYIMRRTQRRERATRQFRQVQALPPQERGAVMVGLLANAVATVLLETTLAVVLARAARRGWQQRQLGPARAARTALTPAVGWTAGAAAAHQVARSWAVQVLDRWLSAQAGPGSPS